MRPANGALDWSTTGTSSFVVGSPGGDLSNATLYSNPIDLRHLSYYSIQLVTTGAPVGTYKLQVSNDNPDHTGNKYPGQTASTTAITNWTDVDGSSVSISAAGSTVWNASAAGYLWVRVVWTKTSGTGNVNGRFNGKGET